MVPPSLVHQDTTRNNKCKCKCNRHAFFIIHQRHVPAEVFEDLDPLHGGALLVPGNGGHAVHKVLVGALRAGDAVGSLPGQHLICCYKL